MPEDDEDVPLEEPAMVNVRDQICNAMWASRGSSTTLFVLHFMDVYNNLVDPGYGTIVV